MNLKSTINARGAQRNVHNRFLEFCQKEVEESDKNKTLYLPVFVKTIVNKVTSLDVSMQYSIVI